MSVITEAFNRKLTEMVNGYIRELYPKTWAECGKCHRIFKNQEAVEEHLKFCND